VDGEAIKRRLALPTPKLPELQPPQLQAPSFRLDFKPPPALEVGTPALCRWLHGCELGLLQASPRPPGCRCLPA
jgi:hypothetical protein